MLELLNREDVTNSESYGRVAKESVRMDEVFETDVRMENEVSLSRRCWWDCTSSFLRLRGKEVMERASSRLKRAVTRSIGKT